MSDTLSTKVDTGNQGLFRNLERDFYLARWSIELKWQEC